VWWYVYDSIYVWMDVCFVKERGRSERGGGGLGAVMGPTDGGLSGGVRVG